MTDLGIKTVGERAMLRKKCREFEQSKCNFSIVISIVVLSTIFIAS